jgi:hypothetical protein
VNKGLQKLASLTKLLDKLQYWKWGTSKEEEWEQVALCAMIMPCGQHTGWILGMNGIKFKIELPIVGLPPWFKLKLEVAPTVVAFSGTRSLTAPVPEVDLWELRAGTNDALGHVWSKPPLAANLYLEAKITTAVVPFDDDLLELGIETYAGAALGADGTTGLDLFLGGDAGIKIKLL